jgi:hypothetical protein
MTSHRIAYTEKGYPYSRLEIYGRYAIVLITIPPTPLVLMRTLGGFSFLGVN